MSNSYAINCDFSELLSGADQKKFRFGIIHEQLVLRHPLPDVLNAMFNRSNCNDLSSAPWDSILNENNVDDMWNDWKGLFMQAVQNNISSKKSNQEEMFHGLRLKYVNCFESVSVYGGKQRPLNCQVIGISTSS